MADSTYDENKEGTGTVLKTDVLGRVKTSERQREAMLDEFERSGLSGTKFAAVAGVNYQTFASWVQKRRKATGAYRPGAKRSKAGKSTKLASTTIPALGWVEAVVEEAKHEASASMAEVLRLELPCGASLQIANEAQAVLAAGLLKALGHPSAGVSC
jgi:hypothetical protein